MYSLLLKKNIIIKDITRFKYKGGAGATSLGIVMNTCKLTSILKIDLKKNSSVSVTGQI